MTYRDEVMERCYGVCEFPGCAHRADHVHHRKLRSQGGPDTAENCMALCFTHHDYIHAHPAESYDRGWLLHSWDAA